VRRSLHAAGVSETTSGPSKHGTAIHNAEKWLECWRYDSKRHRKVTMAKPNREFRRDYDRLFKMDPEVANFFLLLCELADDRGQIATDDRELSDLFAARFADAGKYSL